MTFDSLFSEKLKEERQRLGLKQDVAAAKTGVSREMWGRYERGKANPGAGVLGRFAKIGIDVDYILTGIRNDAVAKELADIENILESDEKVDQIGLVVRLNALHAKGSDLQKGRIDLLLSCLGDKDASKRRYKSQTSSDIREILELAAAVTDSVISEYEWKPSKFVRAIIETAVMEGLSKKGAVTLLEMLHEMAVKISNGKTGSVADDNEEKNIK